MAMKLSSSSTFCSKESKLLYGANKPPQSSRTFMTLNVANKSRKVSTHANSQLPPEKLEMFKSKELFSWAEENFLPLLKPVEESWQPQDFLPNPTSEEFFDDIKDLRARAANIPDDYLVCLVGNMVTEEALPTYETVINTIEGFRDETCASMTPWARWTRMWTAEENRHGDLLNKYLYLTGRCDMRQVEKTIQYLLGSGMDMGTDNNLYNGVIYTSFQERATFISHGNTARHAKHHGDTALAKICGLIAADEKRHEIGYTKFGDKLFQLDPNGMMQAFATMMRKRITMPALLMYDGQDDNLFAHFAAVSQRLGVYTTKDYADMVEFFVERWKVEEVSDLSGEGRRAQEFVCGLAERFRKMEERAQERSKSRRSPEMVEFSWIFNKQIMV